MDFKEYEYHLDDFNNSDPKAKYEIIKDCLAFLNVEFYKHKYIIMGVKEKFNKNGCFEKFCVAGLNYKEKNNYENIIQTHIQNYIEPSPKIDIIKHTYNNKELCIIKVRKENYNRPYLLKRDLEKKEDDGKTIVNPGASFVRVGSETKPLSQHELVSLCRERENTMFAYFDFNDMQIKYDVVNKVIVKMDELIIKLKLDELSLKEKMLKEKFLKLVQAITSIDDCYEFLSFDDYCIETFDIINLGIMDYAKIINKLDNGINSFIIKIFILIYLLIKLENNEKIFEIIKSSNNIIIKIKKELENYMKYETAIKSAENVKFIFDHLRSNDGNDYYTNVLKIKNVDVKKLKNDELKFLDFYPEFTVSPKIIPKLIGPLYGKESYYVGLRELIQNAIDACKIKQKQFQDSEKNEYYPKVEILIKKESNYSTLIVSDNGNGMDEKTLRFVYFKIGESNKAEYDINLVGKFGIGSLAAFLLGDNIQVNTLSNEDNYRYEFSLSKPLIDTSVSNNDKKSFCINRYKKLEGETSGTQINIRLNSVLNKLEKFDDFCNLLDLNNWCLNTNIALEFRYKNEITNEEANKKIINCSDKILKWIEVNQNCNIGVKYFNDSIIPKTEDSTDSYIVDFIRKQTGKILYNDILMKADFKLDDSNRSDIDNRIKCEKTNIKHEYIPFTIIDKKDAYDDNNKEIEIPLERHSIIVNGGLRDSIFVNLYKNALSYFQHDVYKLDELDDIILFNEKNIKQYFVLPVILFCDKGFFFSCKEVLKQLIEQYGYNRLVKFTSKQRNIDVSYFEEKTIYYFADELISRGELSEKVIYCSGLSGFTFDLFKEYGVNKSNFQGGLKTEALKKLLKTLDNDYDCKFNIDENLKAKETWEKFNEFKYDKDKMKKENVKDNLLYIKSDRRLKEKEKSILSRYTCIEIYEI